VGSGFRTFTAGEVLTASNVQNYLMDQSVMVFGGSAARSSAIGTANFEEGMISYLTDTDKVEAYNGTNWAQVGASAQGLTLINTTSFSAVTSQSINDVFSTTYDNYRIVANILGAGAGGGGFANRLRLRVSGADNTASNYRYAGYGLNDASADSIFKVQSNGLATSFLLEAASSQSIAYKVIDVFSPFKTENTSINYQGMYVESNAKFFNYNMGGVTSVTTSYTGFTIFTADAGTTIEGRISVYGYNK